MDRVRDKTYHPPLPRLPRMSAERRVVIPDRAVAHALSEAATGWRQTRSTTKRWWSKHARDIGHGRLGVRRCRGISRCWALAKELALNQLET
jgi:hypothetical protein